MTGLAAVAAYIALVVLATAAPLGHIANPTRKDRT